jgi:hypothetical protein
VTTGGLRLAGVSAGLLLLAACGARISVDPSAEGLGAACVSDDDCGDGQTCHSYAHPECSGGTCTTCEVLCDSDYDCPDGLGCNVPPLPPDTVAQICE